MTQRKSWLCVAVEGKWKDPALDWKPQQTGQRGLIPESLAGCGAGDISRQAGLSLLESDPEETEDFSEL